MGNHALYITHTALERCACGVSHSKSAHSKIKTLLSIVKVGLVGRCDPLLLFGGLQLSLVGMSIPLSPSVADAFSVLDYLNLVTFKQIGYVLVNCSWLVTALQSSSW